MIYKIINEVYFGKKALSELQNQLSIIRNKFMGKPYSYNMNIDPDVLKFNRAMEAFFGYKTFSLNISPNTDINAYAFPVGIFLNANERRNIAASLKASKNGFRHDPKNGSISAICTLNIGTINYKDLSNEEIFAILLHEVGHTFFEAVTDKDCLYTINQKMIAIINAINKFINSIISSGKNFDISVVPSTIKTIIGSLFEKKVTGIITPHSFIDSFKKFFMRESMADNMKDNRLSYTNEKYADSFAVSYGYGVELHSALMKMFNYAYDSIPNKKKATFTRRWVLDKWLNQDLQAYIKDKMDPHPSNIARIKISIDYLKRELAKETMDPKMKAQLLEQINAMQKLLDDFVNTPDDGTQAFVIKQFYIELFKQFGGDRREQDTDNDALFKSIDDRYDSLIK